jgi:hypothetical protein
MLGEVRAQVKGAESWLEKVRNNLIAEQLCPEGQGSRHLASRGVNTLAHLSGEAAAEPGCSGQINGVAICGVVGQHVWGSGFGQRSHQASGPARQPESTDVLTLLTQTQAITSQSLQQVAEGLTRWTTAEMKHRLKDWPVFDSLVIH